MAQHAKGNILETTYVSSCTRDETKTLGIHNLVGQWCGKVSSFSFKTPDWPLTDRAHRTPSYSLSSFPTLLTCMISAAFWQSRVQFILHAAIHPLNMLLSPYCFPAPNIHRLPHSLKNKVQNPSPEAKKLWQWLWKLPLDIERNTKCFWSRSWNTLKWVISPFVAQVISPTM